MQTHYPAYSYYNPVQEGTQLYTLWNIWRIQLSNGTCKYARLHRKAGLLPAGGFVENDDKQ